MDGWRSVDCSLGSGCLAPADPSNMADALFSVRNNFYLGAFNNVLNEAADVENLSELDAIERDSFVYRSYIALGSYEVRQLVRSALRSNS